jgi:hypothetical protein
VKVVGESHYQEALWAATGLENTGQRVAVECIAELVPEPDNPHDPRAIMVQLAWLNGATPAPILDFPPLRS